MTNTKIQKIKAAVAMAYPEATALRYHQATDSVSGYGRQLVRPHNAITNLDAHGNGRYTLARMELNGEWNSVAGGQIDLSEHV